MSSKHFANLLPRRRIDAARGAARLRRWVIILTGYTATAGLLCIGARLAWGQNLRPVVAEADALASQVKRGESSISTARAALRSAAARELTLREVLDHPDWALLFEVVCRRLGDEVVLRDLRVGGAGASSQAPRGGSASSTHSLELRGVGRSQASVARVVAALEATRLFEQVRLLRTAREPFGTGTAAISFEIQCAMADGGRS